MANEHPDIPHTHYRRHMTCSALIANDEPMLRSTIANLIEEAIGEAKSRGFYVPSDQYPRAEVELPRLTEETVKTEQGELLTYRTPMIIRAEVCVVTPTTKADDHAFA